MVIMAIILGFVIGELCHLYDHVHDIFAFLLDKLPFHIEGNQEEYMHLYLFDVFNVWNGIIWSSYRRNVR